MRKKKTKVSKEIEEATEEVTKPTEEATEEPTEEAKEVIEETVTERKVVEPIKTKNLVYRSKLNKKREIAKVNLNVIKKRERKFY